MGYRATVRGSERPSTLETQGGGIVRRRSKRPDGVLLFLGFLSLFHLPAPPKVLLIEEPERGVYPKRLQEIIGILKRLVSSPNGQEIPQIIFTTHSPLVLSHFRPEEVHPQGARGYAVIAKPPLDAPNIEDRLDGGEFYLGELWYNRDGEERPAMSEPRRIIEFFGEGKTDIGEIKPDKNPSQKPPTSGILPVPFA